MKASTLNSKGEKKASADRGEEKHGYLYLQQKCVGGEIKAKCENSLTPLWDVHAAGEGNPS